MSFAADSEGRQRLYLRFRTRNRIVGLLRVAVPAIGVAGLLVLGASIVLEALGARFGYASLRLDRDQLVVEAPELSATSDTGDRYSLRAQQARAEAGALNTVQLVGAELSVGRTGGMTLTAVLPSATLEVDAQRLSADRPVELSSSDGMRGEASNLVWNVAAQRIESGAIHLRFAGGAELQADSLLHQGDAGLTTFRRVSVTLPPLPGAEP